MKMANRRVMTQVRRKMRREMVKRERRRAFSGREGR